MSNTTMAYGGKVLDHCQNPRNVGSFEQGDEAAGTGMAGAPAAAPQQRAA